MKNVRTILLSAFAAIAAAGVVRLRADEPKDTPLITVTGTATVQVPPDLAELTFGVETRASSLTDAQAENTQRTKTILDALKQAGVEAKDLQTDEIEIAPSFGERDTRTKPAYFAVSRNINAKIRGLSKFESTLTAALKAGATHVRRSEFKTTELRRHKDEARLMAVRAAREKAHLLAKELEVKVGKTYAIRELANDWYAGYALSTRNNVVQNYASSEPGSAALTAGMIEITAQIEVSFRIE